VSPNNWETRMVVPLVAVVPAGSAKPVDEVGYRVCPRVRAGGEGVTLPPVGLGDLRQGNELSCRKTLLPRRVGKIVPEPPRTPPYLGETNRLDSPQLTEPVYPLSITWRSA